MTKGVVTEDTFKKVITSILDGVGKETKDKYGAVVEALRVICGSFWGIVGVI